MDVGMTGAFMQLMEAVVGFRYSSEVTALTQTDSDTIYGAYRTIYYSAKTDVA
ncbi:hypothetical protein [Spirosoma arcticum]